jgi:hypothetical protein
MALLPCGPLGPSKNEGCLPEVSAFLLPRSVAERAWHHLDHAISSLSARKQVLTCPQLLHLLQGLQYVAYPCRAVSSVCSTDYHSIMNYNKYHAHEKLASASANYRPQCRPSCIGQII